jgi:hypothetical protein
VILPEDASTASAACCRVEPPVNELVEPGIPGCRPCRRRRAGRIRITKNATKTTRKSQEP